MLYIITDKKIFLDKAREALIDENTLDSSENGSILVKYDGTTLELMVQIGAIDKKSQAASPDWKGSSLLVVRVGDSLNGLQNNAGWEWIDNARE